MRFTSLYIVYNCSAFRLSASMANSVFEFRALDVSSFFPIRCVSVILSGEIKKKNKKKIKVNSTVSMVVV